MLNSSALDLDIVNQRGEKETHYKGMQFFILRHNGVEIGKCDFLGNP